jgi:hypothetical protein
MRPFTEKLWRNSKEELFENKTRDERELAKRTIETRKKLCEGMSEEKISLLEKYEQLEAELSSNWECRAFCKGLDIGVKLMSEVYRD